MDMGELTDYEKSLVMGVRREREKELRRMDRAEKRRKAWMKDPTVRVDGKYRIVKEGLGKHASWGVYVADMLICMCTYKKGANALVDHLLEKDAWCGLLSKKQTGKE